MTKTSIFRYSGWFGTILGWNDSPRIVETSLMNAPFELSLMQPVLAENVGLAAHYFLVV